MAHDWFISWVQLHCQATGAGPDAGEALIINRRIVEDFWRASEAEMTECTNRLITKGRTPKFPNEHMDALGRELRDLRASVTAESDRDYSRQWDDPDAAPKCEQCSGTGRVVVPHPRCIHHGNLVTHPVNGIFYTVAVLCTDCEIGRDMIRREEDRVSRASDDDLRKRPKQLTFDRYTRLIHGHDGVAMLREHERSMAEQVRRVSGDGASEFRRLYPRLAERMANHQD